MPKPVPAPPKLDLATTVLGQPGRDSVIFVGQNTTGWHLDDSKVVLRGDGRAGIVTVNTDPAKDRWPSMKDMEVRGCLIQAEKRDNHSKWGMRRYGLNGICHTQSCIIRNLGLEHAIYDEVFGGEHHYTDLYLDNCGAQGLQIRTTEQPPSLSPHYLDAKTIYVTNVTINECGQARGAGRAGFGLSIKDQGPNADILLTEVFVQTVKQEAVKVKKDGTVLADSFGAICIERARRLDIAGGYVSMKNPDRSAIQLFDGADHTEGPAFDDIVIDGLELDNQVLTFRVDTVGRVRITNPKGAGQIRLQRFDPATKRYKFWKAIPWAPYSQG
jgi:hypothetical protein